MIIVHLDVAMIGAVLINSSDAKRSRLPVALKRQHQLDDFSAGFDLNKLKTKLATDQAWMCDFLLDTLKHGAVSWLQLQLI